MHGIEHTRLRLGQMDAFLRHDAQAGLFDPLQDLTALRQRVAVIRAGRLYDRSALDTLEARGEVHDGVYRTVGHLLRHSVFE